MKKIKENTAFSGDSEKSDEDETYELVLSNLVEHFLLSNLVHGQKATLKMNPEKVKEISKSWKMPFSDIDGIDLAERFLKATKGDLEAINILYNKKIYNLAVYHLQQSIEKTIKAYILWSGKIKPIDLLSNDGKARGHDGLKLILRMLNESMNEYEKLKNELGITEEIIPRELKKELHKANREAKDKDHSAGTFHIEELRNWLSFTNNLVIRIVKSDAEKSKEILISSLGKNTVLDSEEERKLELQMKKLENQIINGTSRALNLLILGNIMFSHESSTRYPGKEGELSPEKYLPENMELVRYTLEIKEYVEHELISVEHLLRERRDELEADP